MKNGIFAVMALCLGSALIAGCTSQTAQLTSRYDQIDNAIGEAFRRAENCGRIESDEVSPDAMMEIFDCRYSIIWSAVTSNAPFEEHSAWADYAAFERTLVEEVAKGNIKVADASFAADQAGARLRGRIAALREQRYGAAAQADQYQRAAQSRRMMEVGAALMATGQPSPSQSNGYSSGIRAKSVGFLSGERVSGLNKICFYNVVGSTHSINVSSATVCPLTAEF